MPTYSFLNVETQEVFEQFFSSSSARDEFLAQNPNLQPQITSAPGIGDPIRLGRRKPDDAFRDKLKDIKRAHLRSTVNTF